MSGLTPIQWAKYSWNPIRARRLVDGKAKLGWHCEHMSPACVPCYAERRNKWIGTGLPFKPQSLDQVELFLDDVALFEPMTWDDPGNVFVCSMTDLFGDFVPGRMIDDVHAIADATPHLNHLMLTKRCARLYEYAANVAGLDGGRWRPNVWYGGSVEDRRRLYRVDAVRQIPAAVRFLSIEPLFEDVSEIDLTDIDWVIVGGLSGSINHPLELDWVRRLLDRCRAAGAAVFVKQLGTHVRDGGQRLHLVDKKGGDIDEWPEDLRVREFPTPRLAA